ASHADGYVLNQTYFNAGCCRRSYQPTQMVTGSHELAACDAFTLLSFYQGDERCGRTHETWCGTLAPMTIDMSIGEMASPATMPAVQAPIGIRTPQFAGNGRAAMAAKSY